MLATKKDGRIHFYINYRKLNSMKVKDKYPSPSMDGCIDSLGDVQYVTRLEAYSGYWQISIWEQDRHKTSFVCHCTMFQCIRMPFGLTNAPACI